MKKPNRYAIRPIRTDADYRVALALVAPYFDNEPALDSDAGAHFEAMLPSSTVHATKPTYFPIETRA